MLDSGTEGPGFKSQSGRCQVTVKGKLFTPIVPQFTKELLLILLLGEQRHDGCKQFA